MEEMGRDMLKSPVKLIQAETLSKEKKKIHVIRVIESQAGRRRCPCKKHMDAGQSLLSMVFFVLGVRSFSTLRDWHGGWWVLWEIDEEHIISGELTAFTSLTFASPLDELLKLLLFFIELSI
jgi:hypothetical protein